MINERERRVTSEEPDADPAGAGELEALRAAGIAHLEAARRALREGLAGDTTAFLRAARQNGGQ